MAQTISFRFDYVFPSGTSQRQVCAAEPPVHPNATDGQKSCVKPRAVLR